MIRGAVTEDGVPQIVIPISGDNWIAVIDTGFNGYLELPESLRERLNPQYLERVHSLLAGGQFIEEDAYLVSVPFDGRWIA